MASRQPGSNARLRQYQVLALLLAALLVYIVIARHVVSTTSALLFAMLIPSVILHEVSHGLVAYWFGDDTAKMAGRLTLNPIPHIDPLGSVIMPAILAFGGFPVFGYAKPVPVDVSRLRSPRNQTVIVSLAGPAVNIILAVLAALALRIFLPVGYVDFAHRYGVLNLLAVLPIGWQLLFFFGLVNVYLAIFNLIPLPPLDGSAVLERLMPRAWWPAYLSIRRYTLPILFIVAILVVEVHPGALARVYQPAINLWGRLVVR
ncbi:MAG: site-2 protease family protein [Acidimicrobiales bacterium]